jgi:hypothetical protein
MNATNFRTAMVRFAARAATIALVPPVAAKGLHLFTGNYKGVDTAAYRGRLVNTVPVRSAAVHQTWRTAATKG